jgi:hypothetical protein
MLQHMSRSRGWNIRERVNRNVGNEIEMGMEIPNDQVTDIASIAEAKGIGHRHLR